MKHAEYNILTFQDMVLLKTIQRFPVRKDLKRCKPTGDDDNNQSVIDGFADTRSDPIKRRKIYRVLDFLKTNREAYRE